MESPRVTTARAEGTKKNGDGHPTMMSMSHIRASPRYTMRQKEKAKLPFDGPGPGAYGLHSPESTSRYRTGPHYCFGAAGREALGETKMPGPGAYTLPNEIGKKGAGYTQSPRRPQGSAVGVSSDVPGPGTHTIKSTVGDGPSFSAAPRLEAGTAIGSTKDKAPGPGEYDSVDNAISEGKPRWGFGTQTRMDATGKGQMATPGPGAYILSTAVGEGPKFSMKSRYRNPRPHPSPGPGAHGGHFSSFH